jgi:protein-tyrosine phosphatase
VMLIDKVLNTKDENKSENALPVTLIHCNSGAGRSALIVLLTMVMCQVRAGYVDLRGSYLCDFTQN